MCESSSWDWEWHEIEIRERIFISTFQIGSTSSLSSIKLCQHTILTHQQFSLAMLQKSFNRILTIISTLFCHCKVNLSNCFCIFRYKYKHQHIINEREYKSETMVRMLYYLNGSNECLNWHNFKPVKLPQILQEEIKNRIKDFWWVSSFQRQWINKR